MDYQDLVIEILASPAGGHTARVTRSPAGQSETEPLSLPITADEIDQLGRSMGRAARDLVTAPGSLGTAALARLGDRLFASLLTGTVRSRYHESLGRVQAQGGSGLRLRIEMGLGNPAMTALHAVPWEYLRSPEDGHFLGLTRDLSIVRYLDLAQPGDRPPVSPPLSILALAGDAPALSDLALEREQQALAQAWGGSGAVRLAVLACPTLEALRDELLAREVHVLHFMGHGGFDPGAGEGSLAFCGEHGRRVWVSGEELAAHLRDRTSLRLAFLNACWTARTASSGPYAGVATALARAGIPAVLAMQFAVSDAAALAFSRSFYRRLAAGDSIDAAVIEGRMAIHRLRRPLPEWGTPVLFERLTSGQIVAGAPRPRTRRRAAAGAALLILATLLARWRAPWRSAPSGPSGVEPPPDAVPIARHAAAAEVGSGSQPAQAGTSRHPAGDGSGEKDVTRHAGPSEPAASRATAHEGLQREAAPAPRTFTLGANRAIYVAELSISVTAEFSEFQGVPLLTLHLQPAGAPAQHRAVLRPTSLDLGPGRGRILVQSINWDAQTVQFAAEPAVR